MIRAGFFRRFIAWFIDNAILSIMSGILSTIFGAPIGVAEGSDSGFLHFISGMLSTPLFVMLLVLQFFYFGFLWSQGGQSIGKKIMGIRVVKTVGGKLPFLTAGLRGTFGYWVSSLVFSLGYIWAAFDSKGEAWHDKIFGTAVIKA